MYDIALELVNLTLSLFESELCHTFQSNQSSRRRALRERFYDNAVTGLDLRQGVRALSQGSCLRGRAIMFQNRNCRIHWVVGGEV